MAVTCTHCGTPNPDGNQYCQSCGLPLPVGAAVAPGPPGMAGPPTAIPSPGGYQSPYASPPSGPRGAPVHRTPWVLIISAVLVLIVVMAGCGTAIAVLGARSSGTQGANTSIDQQIPSPTPAGSPSPVASPAATPSATPGAPNAVSNSGFSVTVGAGWNVSNKDDETVSLTDPSGRGSLTIGSGPSSPTQTAQQNKDTLTKVFSDKYPDTAVCPNSKTTTGTLSGAPGIFWDLCFTLTSGSQSAPAATALFAGANADGTVYYAVILLTTADNLDSFVTESKPTLLSIAWKLK
jgi:hypothetical protein